MLRFRTQHRTLFIVVFMFVFVHMMMSLCAQCGRPGGFVMSHHHEPSCISIAIIFDELCIVFLLTLRHKLWRYDSTDIFTGFLVF